VRFRPKRAIRGQTFRLHISRCTKTPSPSSSRHRFRTRRRVPVAMSSSRRPTAKPRPYQPSQRFLSSDANRPDQPKEPQPSKPTLRPRPAEKSFPQSPTTAPKTLPKLPIPLMLAGLVFVTSISYMGTSAYNLYNSPPPSAEALAAAEAANLIAVYDKTASEFDQEVESTEYWSGLMRLRRKMVKQARGDILESAAGTGRNTEFYIPSNVRSLTLIDASKPMLEICRQKWVAAHPFSLSPPASKKDMKEAKEDLWTPSKTIQFLVYNLEKSNLSPPTHPTRGPGYDTIIQTMGLCSTPSPVSLLTSLSTLLRPGGRILLLEHGKSHYDWLNVILTKSAPGHAARYGCWWNRDIGKICEASGLEIVEIRRPWWFLGTTWWVELRRPGGRQGGKNVGLIDSDKSSLGDAKKTSS